MTYERLDEEMRLFRRDVVRDNVVELQMPIESRPGWPAGRSSTVCSSTKGIHPVV